MTIVVKKHMHNMSLTPPRVSRILEYDIKAVSLSVFCREIIYESNIPIPKGIILIYNTY